MDRVIVIPINHKGETASVEESKNAGDFIFIIGRGLIITERDVRIVWNKEKRIYGHSKISDHTTTERESDRALKYQTKSILLKDVAQVIHPRSKRFDKRWDEWNSYSQEMDAQILGRKRATAIYKVSINAFRALLAAKRPLWSHKIKCRYDSRLFGKSSTLKKNKSIDFLLNRSPISVDGILDALHSAQFIPWRDVYHPNFEYKAGRGYSGVAKIRDFLRSISLFNSHRRGSSKRDRSSSRACLDQIASDIASVYRREGFKPNAKDPSDVEEIVERFIDETGEDSEVFILKLKKHYVPLVIRKAIKPK